jgi:hypothetical protein
MITILIPPAVDPKGAQALWSNLVGLLHPARTSLIESLPYVTWEYLFRHDDVQIRLWVPGSVSTRAIERAIEAAWPGARTSAVAAEAPQHATTDSVAAGGVLRLVRSEALPIRSEFDTDPFRTLLGAASDLGPDESACIQILARPTITQRTRQARHAARQLHKGQGPHIAGRILDAITPGPSSRDRQAKLHPQTSLEFSGENRSIVSKQRCLQWETLIRYAVTSNAAAGRAHALASAFSIYAEHNRYRRYKLRDPLLSLAQRRFRHGDLLSIPELAAVAHLPTDDSLPGVTRAGAKAVAAPPNVPARGDVIRPIGISDASHARPVGLHIADARHHVHVLGATGSGKSTIMARMVLADAEQGRGAVVIDPKGDLINDILERLPKPAAERLVLLDADSNGPVPCLNPLEGPRVIAVENLVSVFSRIFSSAWGARTEDILRAACLTLRAGSEAPTLASLPGLLTDPVIRARHCAKLTDPILKGFWAGYERLSEGARAQATAPLLNKLRALLLRPFVVKAIAAGTSTVDISDVMDHGLCLVRIPKGNLGEDTTRLFGSLIVARVWQAATARAALPQHQRRDTGLYIDETQNFLNLPYSIDEMLAEARGYRLSLTLAHQHLGQLSNTLKNGISTNARTKIFFNASPEDAHELARHTAPRLSEHELSHLDAYHAAARLVVNGAEAPPFTIMTQPLPAAIPGRAEYARETAAHRAASSPRQHPNAPHR